MTTAPPLRLLLLLLEAQASPLLSALLLVGDIVPCSSLALFSKGNLRFSGWSAPLHLLRDLALSAFRVDRHLLYLVGNGRAKGELRPPPEHEFEYFLI